MDYEPFRRYVELRARRQEIKDQLRDLEGQISALGAWMLDAMNEEGVPDVRLEVDGKQHTVSTMRRLWAKVKEPYNELLVENLLALGIEGVVKANTHSLSAYVREELGEGRALHPSLVDLVDVTTEPVISLRTKTREETAVDRADATLAQQEKP